MKTIGPYTEEVVKHFRHPHNYGKMEDPDGVGRVGNLVCLPPKSPVEANSEIKHIDDIKENNRVLSHDGTYNNVSKVFKREYHGEITSVKNRLGMTSLTPEHEVFAISVPKAHHFLYLKNKRTLKPAWHHAFELKKGDIVLYPILKEMVNTEKVATNIEKKKFDFRSKEIPRDIELSDSFLRLCGYYLAEGNLKEEVTKTYIGFAFGISEEEYADDVTNIVRNVFGLDAKKRIVKEHNSISVLVSSVFVTRLFSRLFGNGAASKSIPHFMMLLDAEKQKSLIKGMWRGDGFVNKKIPRAGYSTISFKLWQHMKTLLLRQRIIPSMYVEEEKTVRGVKHRKAYRIHVGGRESIKRLSEILGTDINTDKKESNDSWIDADFAYIPITGISKRQYDGFVHNLSVDNTNTFVTDSLTVHNCGDVMELYIKVKKDKKGREILGDVRFQTFGCVAALASSSVITDIAKGKTLDEAIKISREDVVKSLGGLPPIKLHCSVLSADALSEAIHDYLTKNKKPIPKELEERHARITKERVEIRERYKDWIKVEEEMFKGSDKQPHPKK